MTLAGLKRGLSRIWWAGQQLTRRTKTLPKLARIRPKCSDRRESLQRSRPVDILPRRQRSSLQFGREAIDRLEGAYSEQILRSYRAGCLMRVPDGLGRVPFIQIRSAACLWKPPAVSRLHVGAAQDMFVNGADIQPIMRSGDWKSINVVTRPCRRRSGPGWRDGNSDRKALRIRVRSTQVRP